MKHMLRRTITNSCNHYGSSCVIAVDRAILTLKTAAGNSIAAWQEHQGTKYHCCKALQ